MRGQSDPQSALRDQTWRKRSDLDPRFSAMTGILGTNGAPPNEFGRDQVDLFGDLFSDSFQGFAATGTGFFVGLDRDCFSFQMVGQWMAMPPATAGSSVFPLQHLVDDRSRALRLSLQVLVQRLQLFFLLLRKLVGLRPKQLTLEPRNQQLRFLQLFA